jgi:hypothetical protein
MITKKIPVVIFELVSKTGSRLAALKDGDVMKVGLTELQVTIKRERKYSRLFLIGIVYNNTKIVDYFPVRSSNMYPFFFDTPISDNQ